MQLNNSKNKLYLKEAGIDKSFASSNIGSQNTTLFYVDHEQKTIVLSCLTEAVILKNGNLEKLLVNESDFPEIRQLKTDELKDIITSGGYLYYHYKIKNEKILEYDLLFGSDGEVVFTSDEQVLKDQKSYLEQIDGKILSNIETIKQLEEEKKLCLKKIEECEHSFEKLKTASEEIKNLL